MDLSELQQLFALASSKSWVALVAVLVGLAIRVLKDDRVPVSLPPRWRPALALGLGLVGGALQSAAAGAPLLPALGWGLVAGALAVLGHVYGIEVLRNGKELDLPKGPTTIVPLVLAISCTILGAPGCAALAAVLPDAIVALTEATLVLDTIEDFVRRYFAANPDAKREKDVFAAIGRARSALIAANRASSGSEKLTQKQTDEAFADFRKAWTALEGAVSGIPGLRLIRAGAPMDAVAPGELVLRAPRAAEASGQ